MTNLEVPTIASKPEDLIPKEQKNEQWILDYMKWIWHDYDQCQVKKMFFANQGRYQEIKDYAMGKQSIERYKPMMNVAEGENETEMNIDWSIVPIFPKFRRIALRKLNKIGWNVVATPIDALAQDEKNTQYAKLKAKILAKKALAAIGSPIAENPKLQPGEKEPKDEKELEIMFQFPQNMDLAVEMENGIKLVFYQNGMDQISNQWKEDVMDYGVSIGRDYIDSNGFIRVERIDPEMFIVNNCEKKDFSDRLYAGVVRVMSLADLKQRAQDQFTATEYQDIAKNLLDNFGNPKVEPSNITNLKPWYDDLKVWVFDGQFYSENQVLKEKVVDKRGNLLIGNAYVDTDGKLRGELIRSSYKVVYQGMWLIGTNYIFDYGLKSNMLRRNNSLGDTEMDFKLFAPDFYKMDVTTISEQVIPICDQIQMDWYHLQNVKNEAVPKGMYIDITALENVPLGKGGASLEPIELIDLFKKKGILVGRRIESNGNHQELRPIEELENGIGQDAKFYFDSIVSNINLLKEIAGFNEVTDASTPNPKMLTTIAKMAYEGTDNSLGHILEASKYLIEKMASDAVLALQDLISMGADVSGYIRALGDNTPRFFRLSKNVSNYEYGIMLEDKPTDQERQVFLQEAEMALKAGQLKYSDMVYVKSIDNLKQAQMVLGYLIDKWMDEQENRALNRQTQNGQVQAQAGQQVEQEKRQTLMLDYKLKTESEIAIEQQKRITMQLKFEHDKVLRQMDNNASVTESLIEADSQEYIAEQKNEMASKSTASDQAHKDANKVLNKTA